jgi:3',5'-nucleoside bisphosphate phosphatase
MAAACAAAASSSFPAAELTAEHDDNELHILAYLVDTSHAGSARSAKFQAVRQNRIREMVARSTNLASRWKAEAVFTLANCRSPGRPHVARALVQGGCTQFARRSLRALSEKRPARVGAQDEDVRAGSHCN